MSLRYYLALKYPFTIIPDQEGGYTGKVDDLPGCITQGDTLEEIVEMIEDARRAWIETMYEMGEAIPTPGEVETYSGRFVVRLPKSLHRDLARVAKREGVSLNQYVTSLLSSSVHGSLLVEQAQTIASKLRAFPVPSVKRDPVLRQSRGR